MAIYHRLFACYFLAFIFSSLYFKSVVPCSPNPTKPDRDITELAILAPVVIIAHVVNISVDSNIQLFTQYSACLNVLEVLKRDDSTYIPRTFCTKDFGTEAMCLSHVFPNNSYVFYLNTDLQARYDANFAAARPATRIVIALARRGYCNVENSTNCVPPNITDAPKKIVEAEEGGSVILTCHASGTKPYVVTWFYNGDSSGLPLYSTVGYDGSLFLRKISARYQGRYTCRVKNAAGSVSHETRIIVRFKHCGDMLMVNKKIEITSPNFPGLYPPDKTCVWRLCAPRSYRLKFHFNMFHLHPYDSISIDNECDNSQDVWRKYCGSVLPGDFVSRCKSKCVQMRLFSDMKFLSGPAFLGLNVTVEPTNEKRTKKFDVFENYCNSDLVIKGRFVKRNVWPFNSIKIDVLDIFKVPNKSANEFAQNKSYSITYENEDIYGCFRQYNFKKDHFYFATVNNDKEIPISVKSAIADDGSWVAGYLNKMLARYKNKDSVCEPPT